jgi:hypothetical protein
MVKGVSPDKFGQGQRVVHVAAAAGQRLGSEGGFKHQCIHARLHAQMRHATPRAPTYKRLLPTVLDVAVPVHVMDVPDF